MSTDRIAAFYAEGGGNGHSVKSLGGRLMLSNGVHPMTEGWAKYRRFNPDEELIWVDDADGKPRALTPKQYQVLILALDMIEGAGMTMRAMASALNVAPSTVSRALTKLAAWGLIAYLVGRGRWAGLVIFRRAKDDGMERFRKAAQARVRRWSEAANRRISRLWANVAPYALEEKGYENPYYFNIVTSSTYKSATLTAQPFSVEELRDAGII